MSDGPRIRVAALILVDGHVLLVKHRKNDDVYYLLPGGGVEYRESLAQALQREVAEETGLECVVGRPLIINDTIDPEGTRHVVNITFACEADPRVAHQVTDDGRVVGTELVDVKRLSSLDLRPPIAHEIQDAVTDPLGYRTTYLGSLFAPEHPEAST